MKDPFVTDSGIDSPSRESLRNVDGCYNRNLFKGKSFANSRRALQSGAEKISRTFKCVRNTFGNLSQVSLYITNLWWAVQIIVPMLNVFLYCIASTMFAESRVPDFYCIVRAPVASFWERLQGSSNAILLKSFATACQIQYSNIGCLFTRTEKIKTLPTWDDIWNRFINHFSYF